MRASAGSQPAIPSFDLVVRFALELLLLGAYAYWGWNIGGGGLAGVALGIVLPVVCVAVWGIFGAEGDATRGQPVIAVPGWLRLWLEAVLIGLAVYAVCTSWSRAAAETLLTAFALHYAMTWERSWRLLRPERRL